MLRGSLSVVLAFSLQGEGVHDALVFYLHGTVKARFLHPRSRRLRWIQEASIPPQKASTLRDTAEATCLPSHCITSVVLNLVWHMVLLLVTAGYGFQPMSQTGLRVPDVGTADHPNESRNPSDWSTQVASGVSSASVEILPSGGPSYSDLNQLSDLLRYFMTRIVLFRIPLCLQRPGIA